MGLDLLQFALRNPSVYDELSADGMTPRPQWAPIIDSLQEIGSAELERRRQRAERRIVENGVTYNIYSDPQGANRPWRIDLVPLIIQAEEWRYIEAGVIQRAQLLNLILEDLYGSQKLIFENRLPAELLYANPAFLRPMAGVEIPKQSYLHLLAVDLARSPSGRWWVLADRTQAPSGAGYALENRLIVADAHPDLFRNSNVERLTPFFRAQRDALVALSGRAQPRIVLLTPGPFNETYFEHSYLARYLGFTLVEGADLTVRDRRVYLKTVDGLQQVDVILRRVDDSFCDPLELRGDSYLGVAGLVDAIVAGNVRVANALGSGVIETAAIMPFLPGLSRHILGESLKLPSVATWWCGEDYALEWVMEHLESVVIKPAFPSRPMEPVFGAELAKAEKRQLVDKLRSRPFDYVAQEQVALSAAPVLDGGTLFSRSTVLRTYVVNTGSGWIAMPGGLARVAGAESSVVSMQRGGHSKDTWIISAGAIETFGNTPPVRGRPLELRPTAADLPSRAADNLFWLGRYVERAENKARILRTLTTHVRRAASAELDSLLRLYRCLDCSSSTLPKRRKAAARELEDEIVSLMKDSKRGDSLASTVSEVQRVGGNARERLSIDMLRVIGALPDAVQVEDYVLFGEYPAVLNGCLELLSAFSGMERENITRGPGWLFLNLGRRLERAVQCTRQVREIAAPLGEREWPFLEYLLEVADSSMTYRARYYTTMQPVAVLDVLMADPANPRSLDFQVSHLADLYGKLPQHVPEDLRAMQDGLRLLRSFDLRHLDYPQSGGTDSGHVPGELLRLQHCFKELENLFPAWSNNLSGKYFSHARAFPTTLN